jgi:hypothetical protein
MKKSVFAIVAIASISLAACGGGSSSEQKAADAAQEAADKGGELAKAANGATGIAECDEYLTKAMACFEDKIPEAQRAMMKKGLEDAKAGWAAAPDKAALAGQCKQMAEQAKASYAAMGCSF